jgi:hypothetical protein
MHGESMKVKTKYLECFVSCGGVVGADGGRGMYGLSKEWTISFSAIFCFCFGVYQVIVFIVTHLMLQTIHYRAFRMISCAVKCFLIK